MPNGLHLHVLFIRQSSGTEGKFPTGERVIYRSWYLRRRLKGFISDIYYLFILVLVMKLGALFLLDKHSNPGIPSLSFLFYVEPAR